MPDQIHLTVATVIPSPDDSSKYLIVEEFDKRTDKLVFNQPAGHVDPGESILEAALRETHEETCWHIKLNGFLSFSTYRAPHGVIYHRACFTADTDYFDANAELDPDILRTHWLSRDELLKNQKKLRSPMVLQAIDDYEQGTIHPLSLFRE